MRKKLVYICSPCRGDIEKNIEKAQRYCREAVELWDDIRGSDDCTILINRVRAHGGKSGYFLFGCNQNGHHRSDFAIQDEESLPAAFELFTGFLELKNGLRATCV